MVLAATPKAFPYNEAFLRAEADRLQLMISACPPPPTAAALKYMQLMISACPPPPSEAMLEYLQRLASAAPPPPSEAELKLSALYAEEATHQLHLAGQRRVDELLDHLELAPASAGPAVVAEAVPPAELVAANAVVPWADVVGLKGSMLSTHIAYGALFDGEDRPMGDDARARAIDRYLKDRNLKLARPSTIKRYRTTRGFIGQKT